MWLWFIRLSSNFRRTFNYKHIRWRCVTLVWCITLRIGLDIRSLIEKLVVLQSYAAMVYLFVWWQEHFLSQWASAIPTSDLNIIRDEERKKIDWISPIILCKLIIAIPFHYYYVDVINSICFTGKTRHIRSGMKIGRSLWTHRDGRESNRSACTMCTSWVFILSVHTIFVDIHTVIT